MPIPAPLPWVCSHIPGADVGGSAISWGKDGLEHALSKQTCAGPICCHVDFATASPPLRDRVYVNACDDLCWSLLEGNSLLQNIPWYFCVASLKSFWINSQYASDFRYRTLMWHHNNANGLCLEIHKEANNLTIPKEDLVCVYISMGWCKKDVTPVR